MKKAKYLKKSASIIWFIFLLINIFFLTARFNQKCFSAKEDTFKISIDGIMDKLWGDKATIPENSSAGKPVDFDLSSGLFVKENRDFLYLGLEVDPDPIDGQRTSEIQILIGREGKEGGEDDPFNFSEDRLYYKGFKPYFVVPIQWDSNKEGRIISAGLVKWDEEGRKWLYRNFTSEGGKIAAGMGVGIGESGNVSKISEKNTWLEISIPKKLLGIPSSENNLKLGVLLKSDSRSPGACACIPADEKFISPFGAEKSSSFSNYSAYSLIKNPLPAELPGFSNYLVGVVDFFSQWCVPIIIFLICTYAYFRGVKVYEVFVVGAKEGFNVAVMIIPYLVAILFAIGVFRAGGAEQIFTDILKPLTNKIGMPTSIIPLALVRPLSGAGARGVMLDIFKHYGPDSIDGLIASCIQGSTETTFYVLAVYLGSIGVRRTRYAVPACLAGDIIGFIASVVICNLMFGPQGLQ